MYIIKNCFSSVSHENLQNGENKHTVNMNFYVPVNVVIGKNCVRNNADVFAKAGKKCMIVTGKHSAKKSGALDDLCLALEDVGVEYMIFDRIEQNPSYSSCLAAAIEAKEANVEYIVGVGGGSPLDAAKAVAVLAACNDTSAEAMYSVKWDASPLPIIAIGTTAGTGSEVTPVAVITSPEGLKKSFRAPSTYPIVSFGDATYTMSLSPEFTRSTALDALAHCIESYFNRSANDISKLFAIRGISILAEMLEKTADCNNSPLSFEDREKLYCASIYGGLAISVTGTAFPHALGYFLSEQYNVPHGNACALYLEEFINYNACVVPDDCDTLFNAVNCDKETLIAMIKKNLPAYNIKITEEKIAELAPRYENNRSLAKCHGNVDKKFATELLRKLFIISK